MPDTWYELSAGVDEEEISQEQLRLNQTYDRDDALPVDDVDDVDYGTPPVTALPVEGAAPVVPTERSLDTAVESTGYRVPTDESLDVALDSAFDQLIPGLQDSPLLGGLEWEKPSYTGASYPSASSQTSTSTDDGGWVQLEGKVDPEEEDYGWGIKHAFMRGLIRAGSLIDLAQGDVEEYAEGMRAMEKWEVSKEDAVRLQELQESEGFWEAMGYYITNPALAMQVVVESLPMSTAPLVGGAAGMAVAGPPGAIVGAGLGSFGTEYLASIGEALTEHEVDVKNPTELMAAFADEEFMATARVHAAKRGIGVGAFDALSMGIAGRLYRPIAGLKKTAEGAAEAGARVATKTSATVGGLSELLAQGTGGALGERSAQIIAGDEYDPAAVAGEFIGELVPGVAEIAINKARGKDAVGKDPNAPDALTDPDLDATPEGDVQEGAGPNEIDPIDFDDLDAEGKAYVVPEAIEETPSAPETDAATTPPEETVPVTPEAEVSESTQPKQVDEEKIEAETVATTTSVLISAKELKPKIDKQLSGTAEEQRPIRQAWVKLTSALKERYPDVDLPTIGGGAKGLSIGKFFQKLQEEVDITQDLPDLKTYLETVTEGKPAEIIKSLERLTYAVIAEIPSTTVGAGGPALTQLRSVVNTFNESVKARAKKKGGGKARNLIVWANAVGEFAAGIKKLVDDHADTGVLEGLPADFNDVIAAAERAFDKAQFPRETRTAAGNKTLNIDTSVKSLKKIGDKLSIIADQLSEAIASQEASTSFDALEQSLADLDALIEGKSPKAEAAKKTSKAKKGGTKGRVEPTLSTTEAVTTPKIDKQGRIEPTIGEPSTKAKPFTKAEKAAQKKAAKLRDKGVVVVEDRTDPREVRRKEVYVGTKSEQERTKKDAAAALKGKEATKTSKKRASKKAAKAKKEPKKEPKKAAKATKVSKSKKNETNRARVPKRYHGKKFFFHAVANEDDVQDIVDKGLNIGTNVSRIDGQALEGEGDTILIFEGTTGTEGKGYQADEVVTEMGLRPVAILKDTSLETRKDASEDPSGQEYAALNERVAEVAKLHGSTVGDFGRAVDTADLKKNKELREDGWTDEQIKSIRELNKEQQRIFKNMERYEATVEATAAVTSQDVMEKYRGTGLPVFDTTGEKLKKAVPGAKPDEVFDPQGRGISGKRGGGSQTRGSLLEDAEVEGTSLTEALAGLGVSKAAADKLDLIYKSVSPAKGKKIVKAVNDFLKHKETLVLAIDIEKAVGARPSGDVISAIMEFATAINEQAEGTVSTVREEMIAAYAEDNNMPLESAEAILEDTGEIENQDPNRNWSIRRWFTHGDKPSPSKADVLLLSAVMDKIRGFIAPLVRSSMPGAGPDVFSAKVGKKQATMQEVLEQLFKHLPNNHRYKSLVKRLMDLELTMPVKFWGSAVDIDPVNRPDGRYSDGVVSTEDGLQVDEDSIRIDIVYDPANMDDARFIMNLLHEMVHAATVHAYLTDPNFRAHINELWRQALVALDDTTNINFPEKVREAINSGEMPTQEIFQMLAGFDNGIADYYGMVNPVEMIAETFTNPYFQDFLASIEVIETPALHTLGYSTTARRGRVTTLLLTMYYDIVAFLGYSPRNSLLREVMFISNENFRGQKDLAKTVKNISTGRVDVDARTPLSRHFIRTGETEVDPDSDVAPMTTTTNDVVDKILRQNDGVKGVWAGVKEALVKVPRAVNLGFMNRDAIERNYRELFGKANETVFKNIFNPLTMYVKAKLASSVIAKKYEGKAYKILMRAQKLTNTARAKMYGLMRDVTLAQVWPDKPLNHADNKHLWSKPNKKTGNTFMKPKTAQMAKDARRKFVALQKSDPAAAKIMMEMAALTKEIQKAKMDAAIEALGASFDLDSKQVKALQNTKTAEEIEALFPVLDEDAAKALDIVKGDTDAQKTEKKEAVKKDKDNKYVVSSAKKILKGTSIQGPYFPLRRYGDYVVSTSSEDEGDPIVVFVSTRWKAQQISKALNDAGRKTYVSTKIKSQAVSADLESVAHEISKRLTGPDSKAMRARLQTALIESLAENTAYASQLRRANVDGVAADDMGRAFEEYVHVSKYTIGDMSTAHDVQDALKNMKKLQNAEELTGDERDTIAAVVGEIRNQNKEDANDRDISAVQKVVGAIGFFNFLGAPSYWALNATQTYTVTMPYLTAKWGARGIPALGRAQATVLAAVGKALASNDKSYEGFVAQLPLAAQRIVHRLEEENVIQSTIAHEFGDILSPGTMTRMIESVGAIGRPATIGLKMMEKVPEAVEHFNRISTALAAYNLSGDIVATVDAVQATQFNYDSANRARLLKALPLQAGGGARAVVTPIMMFKTYGIGVSRLLYGSMFDVVMKKEGKAEAAKLAGGLIVTHTLFGGVAGGLMLAPLSMLLAIFNAAFREAGDEFDPEEAVEEFLRDLGMDATAVMVRRGIPAGALGIDMSKSINLGNLLWMGNDRYDFAEAGGVEQAIAGLLGPVAQYGITSTREGYRLISGDNRGNWPDFIAAITPLKTARGIIKGTVYGSEGLHTDSDLQFLDADEISGWARLAMGLGFRSTTVASSMDAYYAELARERRRTKRKSQLIEQLMRADPDEYVDLLDDVQSFNLSLERRGDWINRGDVARLRSQRRSRQRTYDREHPR